MTETDMTGRRILVVEDEVMIALMVQDCLEAMGCLVVGPVSTLAAAIPLANDEQLDGAILDVTIRGGQVFPVAEALLARGIPFVLASGFGDWALPDALRGRPRLTKPFTMTQLEDNVRSICGGVAI